jgi:hypothetical protein
MPLCASRLMGWQNVLRCLKISGTVLTIDFFHNCICSSFAPNTCDFHVCILSVTVLHLLISCVRSGGYERCGNYFDRTSRILMGEDSVADMSPFSLWTHPIKLKCFECIVQDGVSAERLFRRTFEMM